MKRLTLQSLFALFLLTLLSLPLNAQNCDPDTEAPVLSCAGGVEAWLLDSVNFVAQLWAQDFILEAIDNCDETLDFRIEAGDASASPPATESLIFAAPGTYMVTVWAGDDAGNWSNCLTVAIVQSAIQNNLTVSGSVFLDDNENCTIDGGELLLENWAVRISYLHPFGGAEEVTLLTAEDGNYVFEFPDFLLDNNEAITLEVVSAANVSGGCISSFTLDADDFSGTDQVSLDFPIRLEEDCYAMQVDLSAPFLRRCFDNNYNVQYCNYGSQTAEAAYITITFDDFLTVNSSSLPWSAVDGNTYTFDLGDVAPAECGAFNVNVTVSCDALLGQTHCSEAHIFPDQPCDGSYTGPSISIRGRCENDQVIFRLTNEGDEDMQEPIQYIVIEDVIMMEEGNVALTAGAFEEIIMPANGKTFRMEAAQVSGHPGLSIPSAVVEACGTDGAGEVSLGFITLFPEDDADPFISIDCQENIGAYDPNDKQGFPRGVGEAHYIEANTDIEYKIRFQNTGTDTAFNVVVLDTLSELLDATSVRPGASSHPYSFSLLDDQVLRFRFDNIMLPDSNVNEPASHGFIKFRIAQQPDNPLGTEILNSAAIYFDFNEPVLTNMVLHTVGEDFIEVVNAAPGPAFPDAQIDVYPNPFADFARIRVKGIELEMATFYLYHSSGQLLLSAPFMGSEYQLDASKLSSGLYFFTIKTHQHTIANGKLIAK